MQQKPYKSMSKNTSLVTQRAWELLRALLCARKGELCRSRMALAVNAFHKLVRKLIRSHSESRTALLYGDHEFSFHGTPIVHVRMHRPRAVAPRFKLPHIPCIAAEFGDDEEDEDDLVWRDRVNRACFLKERREDEEEEEDSEEGIDERAEEFIAKFYEEMKQQR